MKEVIKTGVLKLSNKFLGNDITSIITSNSLKQEWRNAFVVAPGYDLLKENRLDDVYETRTMERFYVATVEGNEDRLNVEAFIIALSMELLSYIPELGTSFIINYGYHVFSNWCNQVISNNYYCEMIKSKIGNLPNFNFEIDLDILQLKLEDNDYIRRTYFKSFNSDDGTELVRVWLPRPSESWIRWEKKHSEVVKLDSVREVELGFYRMGCDYTLIETDENLKSASLISYPCRENGFFGVYGSGDTFWSR